MHGQKNIKLKYMLANLCNKTEYNSLRLESQANIIPQYLKQSRKQQWLRGKYRNVSFGCSLLGPLSEAGEEQLNS